MKPSAVVNRLIALSWECKPSHLRKGTYLAVDVLMDTSFSLCLGDFNIESSVTASLIAELACLPCNETVSSMYLDICTVYLLLSSNKLPQNLVLVTSCDTYSLCQAREICEY